MGNLPKKTFIRVYTNFKSFIPETVKIGKSKSVLSQSFRLCPYFVKFHHGVDKLKSILCKNGYLVIALP